MLNYRKLFNKKRKNNGFSRLCWNFFNNKNKKKAGNNKNKAYMMLLVVLLVIILVLLGFVLFKNVLFPLMISALWAVILKLIKDAAKGFLFPSEN
jgi:hypothetical protein